ncbi:MAG: leucine-rich repeat domain-containing protein, partial [Clostridia bacterium]|nr:leucine-rich repeat domain-containing protein [Clostridia bacterium]
MKKIIIALLSVIMVVTGALCMVSCTQQPPVGGDSSATSDENQIRKVYSSYVVYAEAMGETPLSYEDWLATIKGEKGDKGDQGEQGIQGEEGISVIKVELDADGNLVFYFSNGTTQVVELPCGIHEHSFAFEETVAPTCMEQGYDVYKCTSCGGVKNMNYTELAEHEWQSTLSYNSTFHWFNCVHCDAVNQKEEHVADENNLCTICSMPVGATEGVLYDLSSDGTYYEVIGYTGTATSIRFAESINGLPVKTIYNNAFYENNKIKTAIIPNSVTSIGDYAFSHCSSLTSVVIGDSVASIGNYAFSWCDSLTSVVIPNSVTSIGDWAFYGCDSLTSVEIGDSVTSIGDQAFCGCYSLTSVEIGASVTSIGYEAFYNCDSLTSVEIPDSVTSIGHSAFGDCNSLQFNVYNNAKYLGNLANPYYALIEGVNSNISSISIHADAKVIVNSAFSGYSRLTSVEIPDSVTSIGHAAFQYCSSLTSVVIGDSVTSIGSSA